MTSPIQLSWHFTLDDMIRSEIAARRGLDNTPPKEVVDNLKRLCEGPLEYIYQMVREIHVTSGYRSPLVNAAVGSKPTSAHVKGLAADIHSKVISALELAQAIKSKNLEFDQLIHEFGQWVHIAMAPLGSKPRMMVLTIDSQGTREGLHEIRPPLNKG